MSLKSVSCVKSVISLKSVTSVSSGNVWRSGEGLRTVHAVCVGRDAWVNTGGGIPKMLFLCFDKTDAAYTTIDPVVQLQDINTCCQG
jgi:hypothetical protein